MSKKGTGTKDVERAAQGNGHVAARPTLGRKEYEAELATLLDQSLRRP